jgi:hypothetical protein
MEGPARSHGTHVEMGRAALRARRPALLNSNEGPETTTSVFCERRDC